MHPHLPSEPARGGVLVPPPAVLPESVPAPRPGYAWISGYWDWKNDHHVWVAGHWTAARHGCHWRRHRWIRRAGRWFLAPGAWVVDERDGGRAPADQSRTTVP